MKKNSSKVFLQAILMLIAVFSAFTLSACKREADSSLASAESVYEFVAEKITLPEMEKADDGMLKEVMAIDLERIEEYELYFSKDKTLADEIGIFKLSDESYRDTLKKTLEARIERAKRAARDYSPKQYEILEKTEVALKDEFVFYIVNEQSENVTKLVLDAIGK